MIRLEGTCDWRLAVNDHLEFAYGTEPALLESRGYPALVGPSEAEPDQWAVHTDTKAYVQFHRRRFDLLIELLDRCERTSPLQRILDVGPFVQTEMIRQRFPGAIVDTLGIEDPRFRGRRQETHYEFNLNRIPDANGRPPIREYDVVVLAEVIEHLAVAPLAVLRYLGSAVRPGGWVVVQTPNACAIHKRLGMIVGRNPFSMITIEDTEEHDLGHIREYTLRELRALGDAAGLKASESLTANYFDGGRAIHKAFIALGRILPATLRDGITMVYRRPERPALVEA
jgi:SAM-dependent methyltransferase